MAQKGLFPIGRERHGTRFWHRFTSYDFARPLTEVPVVAAEIRQAASAFPVAFRAVDTGVRPVAVLSLMSGQDTPFVSARGRWLAPYVPAALRCHPFYARSTGTQGQMAVLVDETSGLITDDPRDEPFFLPDGTASAGLAAVVTFLQNREAAAQEMASICATLDAMALFTPLASHEGVDLPEGMLGIDVDRLGALPDAHIVLLMRAGALGLFHAHQLSLQHCHWLAQAGLQKATPPTDTTPPGNESLDDFLCALAQAHENDAVPGMLGEESTCLQATSLPLKRGLRP